jgi:hypothetical protein
MDAQNNREQKRRGRKAETPQQRLERLERDLAEARRAVVEAEKRKLATIGAAVLAEAESNSNFRDQLQSILRQRVTTKAGKADIAGLLENSTQ